MDSEWPLRRKHNTPVFRSYTHAILSRDAAASSSPSGENAMGAPVFSSVALTTLVRTFQSFTVLSSDADAKSWPHTEKASVTTLFSWPSRIASSTPQWLRVVGSFESRCGIWPEKIFRTKLPCGTNITADKCAFRCASSIIRRLHKRNRLASWTNFRKKDSVGH